MLMKTRAMLIAILMIAGLPGLYSLEENTANQTFEKGLSYITLRSIDQIYKLLENDDIRTPIKVLAIRRMSQLYRENPDENKKHSDEILQATSKAMQKHTDDKPPAREYQIRAAGCNLLAGFANSSKSGQALKILENYYKNDKHDDVFASCAQSISRFKNQRKEANSILVEVLNKQRGVKSIGKDDIRRTMVTLGAIERIGHHDAYLPLMKFLQSGYPADVKKAAQRALTSIKWDKT